MAPAQALATLELDRSPGSLTQKENRDICEVNLRCTNNRQDDTFGNEALPNQHQVEEADDLEVGITDCTKTSVKLLHEEDPDATEYSSSFGGTLSGSENGFKLNSSDGEVESQFRTENEPSIVFDGVNGLFSTRKKRLTAHWRRYICPLMWRCKWIELRVKELHSQASKYDKELLAYANEKQLWTREPSLEGPVARPMPLSCETQKKRTMKRRKRRRMEDTVDIPSYMSRHSLFSYYENKNMVPDGLSFDCNSAVTQAEPNHHITDECGVSWEWLPLQSKDGDSSLEQILWNIEVLQSRVERLQTKLDKVVSRNGGKLFLTETLSNFVPSDVLNSSAQSPNIFPANGDETLVRGLYTPPGHISDYEIEDLVGPESAVSSFGDANLPDIIESTRGLLSAVDRSLIQPQMGDFCKETADDILIHNQSAKEGLHDFEKVTKLIEKSEEAAQGHSEEKHTPEALAPETDQVEEPVPPSAERETGLAHGLEPEKLDLGSCLVPQFQRVPKNKRKRRHHKATSGRWNAGKVYRRRSLGLNHRK